MDYHRIPHFLAAVRHGSLTEAAAALEISQPALSKSINALEKSLGARLLERGRFGVRPTPYGEALMVRASVIEAEMRNARGEIDAMKGAKRGHVLMGCGPTEANRLLPQAIAKLHRSHPDLRITVLYGLNEALMPWVKQGEIDFALSSVPMQPTEPELAHERLFIESGVVVARVGHPLAKKAISRSPNWRATPGCCRANAKWNAVPLTTCSPPTASTLPRPRSKPPPPC